jgi:transcriptional regulator with XRE-family HTH domain
MDRGGYSLMDKDARWLNSDSQILAKVKQSPHKQGTLCSLTMPWGEECQAVVEKWNAASAQQFCELAREMYNARKDEQEAKQARAAYDKQIAEDERAAAGDGAEAVPAPEETVEVNPLDPESVAARVGIIRDRETVLNAELNKLRVERTKLLKILEVLNAPEDDESEFYRVPRASEEQGQSEPVDIKSCEEQLHAGGESDAGEDGSEDTD